MRQSKLPDRSGRLVERDDVRMASKATCRSSLRGSFLPKCGTDFFTDLLVRIQAILVAMKAAVLAIRVRLIGAG